MRRLILGQYKKNRFQSTKRFCTNMDPRGAVGVSKTLSPASSSASSASDAIPKITPNTIKASQLPLASLESLHRKFFQVTKEKDSMSIEEFAEMFPLVDVVSKPWLRRFFRSFDSNNNGRIDMHELACGMGALWRAAQTQMRVPAAVRSHEPGQVRLVWPERPRTALIVKKWRDSDVTQMARHAGVYLQQRGVVVKVEERVRDDDLPEFEALSEDQLSGDVASEIDFVLCLGGDGTLLHLSSLLTGNGENAVPPVVSFGLGSLGFLTPFDIRDIEHCLDRLLDTENQELFCSIRTFRVRLREHIKFILLHEEE